MNVENFVRCLNNKVLMIFGISLLKDVLKLKYKNKIDLIYM